MKTRIGLTKIDVAIALVCVAFGIATVGAIGKAGRERAKRAVCMGNLRALTAAWAMYSDDNGGILVNASAGFSKTAHGTRIGTDWPCWVDAWNLIISMRYGQTERAEQLLRDPCDIREIDGVTIRGTNLLYRYCGNLRFFKCPSAEPGEVLNYSIVSAMAGSATWLRPGHTGPGHTVHIWPPFYRRSEILRPSKRFVFVDEGRITVDSWDECFTVPRWYDPPSDRHNMGQTFSFADGHTEYRKWTNSRTIDLIRLIEAGLYKGFYDDPEMNYQPCNEDLEWVQIHAWGRLGYDPQALGCP